MEDSKIIDLYFARSEKAVEETAAKYGSYCFCIAHNILGCTEDAEESVNDTYMGAWNAIPPTRPGIFSAFLGKLCRSVCISRWRRNSAAKRGGGELALVLDELAECVGTGDVQADVERRELEQAVKRFLGSLIATERDVFLCRYWYSASITEIAGKFGFSESKVKSMLLRLRKRLRTALEKEELI